MRLPGISDFSSPGMLWYDDHDVNEDYDDDGDDDDDDYVDSDDDRGQDINDNDDDVGDNDRGQECLGNIEPWRHSLTEGNNCQGNAGPPFFCVCVFVGYSLNTINCNGVAVIIAILSWLEDLENQFRVRLLDWPMCPNTSDDPQRKIQNNYYEDFE